MLSFLCVLLSDGYVCDDQSAKFYSLNLIFSTLCVFHDLILQRKLSRRRLPITSVYFVSHAGEQALRPITFTQRFKTTRHLFSIQSLWKPKILNVVWTIKRRSRSIFIIMQIIFDTSAIEQNTDTLALFLGWWWMKARYKPAGLRQSVTSLVNNLCSDILF